MYQIFVALFADSAMTKYKNNETATYLYLKLKDLVSGVIRRNAYSEVNLDKLFQSTFQIKTKNHQLTGWYWVDNRMSYKPYENLFIKWSASMNQVNSVAEFWFLIWHACILWWYSIYQFHGCPDILPISQMLCNFYTLDEMI